MMTLDIEPTLRLDYREDNLGGFWHAALYEFRAMHVNVPLLLRIENTQVSNLRPVLCQHPHRACVANLSAHFRIERRLIEYNVEFQRLFAYQGEFNVRL